MNGKRLQRLSEAAPRALEAARDQEAAFEADAVAEATLLEEAIRIARPALPTITGKMFGLQGVAVAEGLVVLGTGVFHGVEGGMLGSELTARQVVERHDPVDILARIVALLDKQTLSRPASAMKARAHTEALQAILTLLRRAT